MWVCVESVIFVDRYMWRRLNVVLAKVRKLGSCTGQHSHVPGRHSFTILNKRAALPVYFSMIRLLTGLLAQWILLSHEHVPWVTWRRHTDKPCNAVPRLSGITIRKALALPPGRICGFADNGHPTSGSSLPARPSCPRGNRRHGWDLESRLSGTLFFLCEECQRCFNQRRREWGKRICKWFTHRPHPKSKLEMWAMSPVKFKENSKSVSLPPACQ